MNYLDYENYIQSLNEKEDNSFSDYPISATNNAKKAIEWKEKYGRDEVQGGTSVGWARAHQLANKENLSLSTVKRMAQFNRHRKNSEVAEEFKSTPWKDNGYVAWLLWGGTSGVNWAINKVKSLNKRLLESKASAEAKYLNKNIVPPEVFYLLCSMDTSPTYKYVEMLCKFYSQGSTIEEIHDVFSKAMPLLYKKILNLDVNSVKSLDELKVLIEEKSNYKSLSDIKKHAIDNALVVLDNERFKIVIPKTEEAAIYYGKGTPWCISYTDAPNQFNEYIYKWRLIIYIIIDKTRKPEDELSKVAVVIEAANAPGLYGRIMSTWNSKNEEVDFHDVVVNRLELDGNIFKYRRIAIQ